MDLDVCAIDDLAEGAMRTVEIGGEKILLARAGGRFHAVAATCPHAGAPLADGVLMDGTVICPWHKAAFCVATGKRQEPPAVDDLARFPVRVADGRVLVSIDEPCASDEAPVGDLGDPRCMAIVGSGAAGALAAQTLREEGFRGRVVLIGEDTRLPYDRTVLSKYALSGRQGGEKTPLQNEAYYARHRIERLAATVTSLDPEARTLTFGDGRSLRYDAALVATGGHPRALDRPGHDLAGVHRLRTAADAEAIVGAAKTASQAVVIGAGFIGLEAAASLRERGLAVAVVAPEDAPLQKPLGAEVGTIFRRVHEREGVVFHLNEEVATLEGDGGHVRQVRLKSGLVLPADVVVVGLGITPATGLVQGIGRCDDGALAVDAELRVADGLFAAGDIAAFPLRGTGPRVRVEHWRVAEQQGAVAALNMMGRHVPYAAVPVFWTIHFMKRLDYVGHSERWDSVVIEGDREKPAFLAYYIEGGRVAAVAGWGRDRQMALAVALMTKRYDWTLEALQTALSSNAG